MSNDLGDVRALAESMMAEHLDANWTFRFSSARATSAVCHSDIHQISMSRWHAFAADEYTLRNTMLHEIAHALIPYVFREPRSEDHGDRWANLATSLGCNLYWGHDPFFVARYRGLCVAGHRFWWQARLAGARYCGKCNSADQFDVTSIIFQFGPFEPTPIYLPWAVINEPLVDPLELLASGRLGGSWRPGSIELFIDTAKKRLAS